MLRRRRGVVSIRRRFTSAAWSLLDPAAWAAAVRIGFAAQRRLWARKVRGTCSGTLRRPLWRAPSGPQPRLAAPNVPIRRRTGWMAAFHARYAAFWPLRDALSMRRTIIAASPLRRTRALSGPPSQAASARTQPG